MMECNRDEALRAKEIAEKKLASQDYQGALKLLQKALQIFPALENTSQLSAVLDVHIAAQAKINGTETDWYGILQVDPKADEVVIKKQYKKLALLLHPDKNKYAGAESAFKLLGEALQVLSDKQQRYIHDSRRKPVASRSASSTQRSQSNKPPAASHSNNRQGTSSLTFITVCPSCHTRYQYYRIYENQNLLCHQCHTPFFARELNVGNGAYASYNWQHYNHQTSKFSHSSYQSYSGAANFAGTKMPEFHTTADSTFAGASKSGSAGRPYTSEYLNQGLKEKQQTEASQGVKRKRKDDKDTEKEMRRMEREQQRKAKADQRAQEALERMLKKQKEQADKATSKDKKRRQKKRLSDSSEDDEDDDDESDSDDLSDDQAVNNAYDSKSAPRRSSRPRRNVTYKVDVSDDEENPNDATKAQASEVEEDKFSDLKEKDSQNGDSVDMKEKQKLADFFKFRIRLNLNMNRASKSSMTPNGESEKSNGGDAKMKHIDEDEEATENNHQDNSPRERDMDQAKNSVREQFMECVNDSVRKQDIDQVEDSVRQKDMDQVDVSVEEEKPASREDPIKEESDTEHVNDPEEEKPESIEDPIEEESQKPASEGLEETGKFKVPDPDFHNFDKDREEKDVAPGQIWAGYDDTEGLPRFYFKVKSVQSRSPFKVNIVWLELRNATEEQRAIKQLGYYPSCGGGFRSSFSQVLDTVEIFSHILKWEKGPKGVIKIYPMKGDVWALYSNWKPGIKLNKTDSISWKYQMVEVLQDFRDGAGLSVAPLEKLSGFKTVFKRTRVCREIPLVELCRFSHQVPAYKLQGNEARGIEQGCWDLDPASVPTSLLNPTSKSRSRSRKSR